MGGRTGADWFRAPHGARASSPAGGVVVASSACRRVRRRLGREADGARSRFCPSNAGLASPSSAGCSGSRSLTTPLRFAA